jgi:hypothetical protein
MSDFLHALGYSPLRYWLFATACLVLWLGTGFAGRDGPPPSRLWHRLGLHLALLLVAMAAFRWPTLLYKPVNPDESQYIASAITMVHRHVFWWPDTMTSGPLGVAPLTVAGFCGLPMGFVTARAIALLLSWGMTVCLLLGLRHLHGDRLGRLLALPLGGFLVLLDFWDFTPYVSEWCPLFLCALATALVITAFAPDGMLAQPRRLIGAGLVLGALPFSKLQSVPIGAAIGVWAIIGIVAQPNISAKVRGRALAGLLTATVATALALVAWAALSGSGPHVFQAYVRHNLIYAQARAVPWSASLAEFRYLAGFAWGFAAFHHAVWILLAAGLAGLAWRRTIDWRQGGLILSILVAAYYAAMAPGRAYPHYLLFTTFPLALAAGALFGGLVKSLRSPVTARVALAAYVVLGIAPQLVNLLTADRPVIRLVRDPRTRREMDDALARLKQPGDTLAVWGWRPEIFVETGLPQGTRESMTERQMSENPMRDYFRGEFLADVRANRPAFLVDAVGPGGFIYQDPAATGIATFPALAAVVEHSYHRVGELDGFVLYVRLDRWPPTAEGVP